MPQAAAVLWSQWEKFHSHAVGRGLRDSRYLRSALNRIPTSQISHLSCDSTDALLGKIARVHLADRHFYPAGDCIWGAGRLAGHDTLRHLCFRYGRRSGYRRLGQSFVTLRRTNAFHDGIAGLPHTGAGAYCQKIRTAGQALCDQGRCRDSWRHRGDRDFGLLPESG